MLVLTRKQNEKIVIGDDITITVVRAKGKSVRLGIEAPANIRVLRGEVKLAVDESTEQNAQAAAAPNTAASRERPTADEGARWQRSKPAPVAKSDRDRSFDESAPKRSTEEGSTCSPIGKSAPLPTLTADRAFTRTSAR